MRGQRTRRRPDISSPRRRRRAGQRTHRYPDNQGERHWPGRRRAAAPLHALTTTRTAKSSSPTGPPPTLHRTGRPDSAGRRPAAARSDLRCLFRTNRELGAPAGVLPISRRGGTIHLWPRRVGKGVDPRCRPFSSTHRGNPVGTVLTADELARDRRLCHLKRPVVDPATKSTRRSRTTGSGMYLAPVCRPQPGNAPSPREQLVETSDDGLARRLLRRAGGRNLGDAAHPTAVQPRPHLPS